LFVLRGKKAPQGGKLKSMVKFIFCVFLAILVAVAIYFGGLVLIALFVFVAPAISGTLFQKE